MLRYSHKLKASGYILFKEEFLNIKNTYFNLIKKAKSKYWNTFLEKEDT
jgi:hypothetical protein